MTEKRFKLAFEDFDWWAICDTTGEYSNDEDFIDWLSGQKAVDVLNELNDENKQLRKFIMDLQNMIQFDVDNGIKTYPKTLSEYLANALKVMLNEMDTNR